MDYNYDLSLPDWGPYSRDYPGLSHLPDLRSGLRWQVIVCPALCGETVHIPSVVGERWGKVDPQGPASWCHVWEAAPDLSYYSRRHQLIRKDKVYAGISFSRWADNVRLIRCECINSTLTIRQLSIHLLIELASPGCRRPDRAQKGRTQAQAVISSPGIWVDALDYTWLSFAKKHPITFFAPEGFYRGEERYGHLVGGSGLNERFGARKGDRVDYSFRLNQRISSAQILFRFMAGERPAHFQISGVINKTITLKGKKDRIELLSVPAGNLRVGKHTLSLQSAGTGAVVLDGFAILPTAEKRRQELFVDEEPVHIPQPELNTKEQFLVFRYKGLPQPYAIVWDKLSLEIGEIETDDLLETFKTWPDGPLPEKRKGKDRGKGKRYFNHLRFGPFQVEPGGKKVVHLLVATGEPADTAKEAISLFRNSAQYREEVWRRCRLQRWQRKEPKVEAKGYQFSQERLGAVIATNIVYPIYIRRHYVRHYVPDRWHDTLYTWDAGFTGLGLLELDPALAVQHLNAYLTEPGDEHAAFILHGTPLPVQIYLFWELWQRSQDRNLLEFFYPRLRQFHRFLTGKSHGSDTAKFASGILATWSYFYNSGGWDDYPAQSYMHEHNLTGSVAPVVNTAQAIRTAKILRLAAYLLGKEDDIAEYSQEIEQLTKGLQKYSWDEKTGYFSYVVHDDKQEPTGILRHKSGVNFNCGLDGIYPLVAGAALPEQEKRLLEHMHSPEELWTPVGISTVDRTAPYYDPDGYWNGALWPAHQWFIWKALLGMGENAFAWQIADNVLEAWRRDIEDNYICFESISVETGKGRGTPQFGALSSPLLLWYRAYYQPNSVTTDFDTIIEEKTISEDKAILRAKLNRPFEKRSATVLVNMKAKRKYQVRWNGNPLNFDLTPSGTLQIMIPEGTGRSALEIY